MSELKTNTTEPVVHLWNHCHHCQAEPVVGRRYECQDCPAGPDIDLCEPCYNLWLKGEIPHPAKDSFAAGLNIPHHRFEVFEGRPLSGFTGWFSVPFPQVVDPVVPTNAVLRPIFNAGNESAIGSYAFAIQYEGQGRPLILTALHVMDELIKNLGINCSLKHHPVEEPLTGRSYTGRELPGLVNEVNLFDVYAATWMMAPIGDAGPMLVLPEAATGVEEPFSHRDIAAFWVKPADAQYFKPLILATSTPKPGEPVWLAARSMNNPAKRSFKAVVVEYTERSLVFKYQDSQDRPKYTSGAPILNQQGQVVGINVGGGCLQGQFLGHANHVDSIRKHLKNAC